MLQRIADKDLDLRIQPRSPESTVDIIAIGLLDALNDAMGEIQQSSEQVSQGSKQIADGAAVLAQGTSEQNVTINYLAEAVSNVSEKTRVNSEMANKANSLGLSTFILADTVARFKLRDTGVFRQGKQSHRLPEANRK